MSKELNIIEKAIKITTFRENVRKACRKEGLEYPTDEQIAKYIENGHFLDANYLMIDYKNKAGVFRTPFSDFRNAIDKITWAEGHKPTIEEMTEWTSKNGYDVSLFIREHTIKELKPFYRKTIEKALKLNDETLVHLWNYFIKESAWYGEDSYIYDITNKHDSDFISKNFEKKDVQYIINLVAQKNARFIQIFGNDKTDPKDYIHMVDNVKNLIVAFWTEIVDRIMSFADLYYDMDGYLDYDQKVMNNVFQPTIREMLEIPYKENNM